MLRKNWRDYLLSEEEAEESKEAFVVFEEYGKGKYYDLSKGIFKDFEVAKEYAEAIHDTEDLFIAKFDEYISGNYDYLFEINT